ncbi:MAG: hypothetical protein IJ740_08400 [Ruminococcus sp.]|nr:hypothetical protein [Ruminococcus sp.]
MKLYCVAFGEYDSDGLQYEYRGEVEADNPADAYDKAEEEYGERPIIVYEVKD